MALTGPALEAKLKKIALTLQEQTIDRIETGGDDEYRFPPLDFARPSGDRDNPLYNTGTHLRDSITSGVDNKGPWVGSNFVGANVLQHGTKGKGGTIATITPKKAKALFIPLTSRAVKSVNVSDASRGRKVRKSLGRRGHGDLVKGVDFIFRQSVDIRPRHYLRLSKGNLDELVEILRGPENGNAE